MKRLFYNDAAKNLLLEKLSYAGMPLIEKSEYQSPFYLFNSHLQTIVPSLLRKVKGVRYRRERISTPDGDFLDLDWSRQGFANLAIISHGLEGDSQRPYVKGMVKALNAHKWDVLAWNFRGCSGEMNRNLRFYHSGATDDLEHVIRYALACDCYETVALIGFSLGGNLTLKYLGEQSTNLPAAIRRSVVFSVPLCLSTSSDALSQRGNYIYERRFLNNLRKKIAAKSALMPDKLSLDLYKQVKRIKDFDDVYTAPLHGFKDAASYYQQCSSKEFLAHITIPTLIVNAKNDPFLSPECYPAAQVEELPHVFLEIPDEGGHCGFASYKLNGMTWSEGRTLRFLKEKH